MPKAASKRPAPKAARASPPSSTASAAGKAAETERRKEEHLRIPLEKDVQSIPNPWTALRLRHNALPELDRADVDLSTKFLGRRLGAPIQVTGMTGGARKAKEFNDRLAAAAAEHGLAMGVGSQRAALENPSLADTYSVILDHEVPLRFANLGLPQVILWGEDAAAKAEQAVEMVEAHALYIHLNYLQEAVQPEGDLVASGGLAALRRLAGDLKVPVLAKETGAGMTGATAAALAKAGAAGIDVGGLGGTSFAAVEHHRAVQQGDAAKARLGSTFWDWGIPTPQALREARAACPGLPLVATGGLSSGLDALKALALGADLAGFAGHMFRAAAAGPDGATREAGLLLEELKTGLFLLGLPTPSRLTEDLLA
ncbi:MAG TPA: type 2 isopentenyl-diphosphate Delta-isomerase [Candidatus Thermoplasmatota archaeon]|nr:type 2 isopentenyl-diphosphate Delta-isomerase [Candidatus Thermoplasmatota archaeon]